MNGYTSSFAGIPVIKHDLLPSAVPKLKLHPDVPVTDEICKAMDAFKEQP